MILRFAVYPFSTLPQIVNPWSQVLPLYVLVGQACSACLADKAGSAADAAALHQRQTHSSALSRFRNSRCCRATHGCVHGYASSSAITSVSHSWRECSI